MIIVHVDDDDLILEHYGNALIEAGHDYHPISNPHKAIDTINQIQPELAILDVAMPYLNGIDLLSEIRKIEQIASLRAIYLTNMPFSLCGEKARELGALAYLSKRWHTPLVVTTTIDQILKI